MSVTEDGYYVDTERPWLGGFRPGGDPYSFYPKMWTWLVEKFRIRSVLDVGCGEGQSLDFFESLGCLATGVDGIEQPDRRIICHDFTKGPYLPTGNFDLIWSCEFVEHVEEQFIGNFLQTFQRGKLLLMTHAFPGQGGYHHVNCQNDAYWVDVMAAAGFFYDEGLTVLTKSLTKISYYYYTGLAFRRV